MLSRLCVKLNVILSLSLLINFLLCNYEIKILINKNMLIIMHGAWLLTHPIPIFLHNSQNVLSMHVHFKLLACSKTSKKLYPSLELSFSCNTTLHYNTLQCTSTRRLVSLKSLGFLTSLT